MNKIITLYAKKVFGKFGGFYTFFEKVMTKGVDVTLRCEYRMSLSDEDIKIFDNIYKENKIDVENAESVKGKYIKFRVKCDSFVTGVRTYKLTNEETGTQFEKAGLYIFLPNYEIVEGSAGLYIDNTVVDKKVAKKKAK